MGCCLSNRNPNGKLKDDQEIKGPIHLNFKSINETIDELEKDELHKKYQNPFNNEEVCVDDILPINMEEEELAPKLKREILDCLKFIFKPTIFEFPFRMRKIFFETFDCELIPELSISFRNKNLILPMVLKKEENQSNENESKLSSSQLGKRKSNISFNLNLSKNGVSLADKNDKTEKTDKNYYYSFNKSSLEIQDIKFNPLYQKEENYFIYIALFTKTLEEEKFQLGEAYLPLIFLTYQMDDAQFNIPISNIMEDVLIGNLSLSVSSFLEQGSNIPDYEANLKLFNQTNQKEINEEPLSLFLNHKLLNLFDWPHSFKTSFKKRISISNYSEITRKIHDIIQKFIQEGSQKETLFNDLQEYFFEDLGLKPMDVETNKSSNILTSRSSESISLQFDFKTLDQVKYFSLIFILNKIIKIKEVESFTHLKKSNIFDDFVLFSPYSSNNEDDKNYLLAESVISLLLNCRLNSSKRVSRKFQIATIFSLFAKYYVKCRCKISDYLRNQDMTLEKIKNNEINFELFSKESFVVFRNLVFKFLKLVNTCIEFKIDFLKNLGNEPEKEKNSFQEDIQAMRDNGSIFLKIYEFLMNEVPSKKQDPLIVNDLEFVLSNLKLYTSYVIYAKKLSEILGKSHKEVYLENLLSQSSDFVKFIAYTFKYYYKNIRYLNNLLNLLTELLTHAYGIFIFNLFKAIDLNLLFESFKIRADGISSNKFHMWSSLFTIVCKVTKLIKKSGHNYFDFLSIKSESILHYMIILGNILQRNRYFRLEEKEINFRNPDIIIIEKSIPFMSKQSPRIFSKFFEIFRDLSSNKEISEIMNNNFSNFIKKIIARMVLLILLELEDGEVKKNFDSNVIYCFRIYISILYFFINLKNFGFNIQKRVVLSTQVLLPSSYEKNNNLKFSFSKTLEKLFTKIDEYSQKSKESVDMELIKNYMNSLRQEQK